MFILPICFCIIAVKYRKILLPLIIIRSSQADVLSSYDVILVLSRGGILYHLAGLFPRSDFLPNQCVPVLPG